MPSQEERGVYLTSNTNKMARTRDTPNPITKDLFTPYFGIKKIREIMYIGQTKRVASNEDLTVIITALLPETLLIK